MRNLAILTVALLLVGAGCKSAATREVEGAKMVRVRLEPVPTTEEMQAEIAQLIDRLKHYSETVYKDELDGMQSDSIDRLLKIGQPAAGPLIEGYYEALERHDQVHFRYLVLAILKRMKEPATQVFLVQVLRRGDRKERRLAAEALWWFGDSSVIGDLIRALDDESIDVVNTVASALRAITSYNFGLWRCATDSQREEAIKRWRRWWSVAGISQGQGRAERF
jgi:HEAT repeat protein